VHGNLILFTPGGALCTEAGLFAIFIKQSPLEGGIFQLVERQLPLEV